MLVKKQKKTSNKSAGIRLKINACILGTLAVLIALMAILIFRSNEYNTQYSQILDSISKVTYINDNASYLGRTVVTLCGVGGDIPSSGHIETIDTMEQYVAEVGEDLPRKQSIRKCATSMINLLPRQVNSSLLIVKSLPPAEILILQPA